MNFFTDNKKASVFIIFCAFLFSIFAFLSVETATAQLSAVEKTRSIALEIARKSYPEIKLKKIRVKIFESENAFFKAQFSITRFMTFQRMRYTIYVNPQVFEKSAPSSGIHAIIAHELAHVSYYVRKNRFELLGLASLLSKEFTIDFERKADIEAIARGYGEGLIEYRKWLYGNIPDAKVDSKTRTYFSPEELKVMLEIIKAKPSVISTWRKRSPKNLEEIKKSA